jgi:tRNA (guanine37-N1)-methyltransferase
MTTPLTLSIITLFPKMFQSLHYGVVGRAIENNLVDLAYWNPRDFTQDVHHTVDDRPYGGGPGMVMKYEPLHAAIQAAKAERGHDTHVVHLSPQGQRLTQASVAKLLARKKIILVSGRYEGIDERLIEQDVDEEYSIGDYVLSGGEFPAMVLVDAMTRLLPGALGDDTSASQDSFATGLLDHPHYTRPESIAKKPVPKVLLSGDHATIARWRLRQALGRTWQRRPDLIKIRSLTQQEQTLLNEFIEEDSRHSDKNEE